MSIVKKTFLYSKRNGEEEFDTRIKTKDYIAIYDKDKNQEDTKIDTEYENLKKHFIMGDHKYYCKIVNSNY